MSIVWVHEALPSGSGAGAHDSGSSYARLFDVLTDTFDDNAATVSVAVDPVSSLAIPSPYDYFDKGNDTDYGSIVTRIVPDRDARQPLLWHVRVEYTVLRANTANGQWPGGTLSTSITLTLPDIRIWSIPVNEELSEDINGDPFVNTAGDLFDNVEDIRYITAIEIKWFIRTYNFDDWEPYADSTNAVAVWGRAPDTVLMIGAPSATRKVDNYGTYYEIRAEFRWDKTGWKWARLNAGKNRLVGSDGISPPSATEPPAGKVPVTDMAGVPVNEDVALDAQGQPIGINGTPIKIERTIKQPADWSAMNLPQLNVTF